MKKKSVTIYDIAERLNLSPSTISRGLRDDARINEHTKALITEAAAELNYQPNRVAAGLRGGSTKTIGVIVPRINTDFFANAITGIEQVARQHGFIIEPTISSVEQFSERMGAAAAELLFRQINSEEVLDHQHIMLTGELQIRNSSLRRPE